MCIRDSLMTDCAGRKYPEAVWPICLVLLALPGLNHYRDEILREYGCWFFFMLTFWLSLRWSESPRWPMALLAQLALVLSAPVSYTHLDVYKRQAYHCSGFTGKTAILGIDGKGEYATTFFGYGENGKIHKIKEFYDPDSLGGLYGAITEYLGFEMLDGEYKVMGLSLIHISKRSG